MYYNMEESGVRIKKLRTELEMTQEEIAELVGIAQSSYARIESGKKGVSIDTLVAIAEVLNTSLDYIILGKVEQEQKINFMLENYPEEKKLLALKILKGILENL